MRYQLRLYRVKGGELDEWLEEWREHVLPLRRVDPDRARDLGEVQTWLMDPA